MDGTNTKFDPWYPDMERHRCRHTQKKDGPEATEGHQGMSATIGRLMKTGHILCRASQGSGHLSQLAFELQALRTMRILMNAA